MTEIERAVQWFENRLKNTPMPAAREMYRTALAALEEKLARESGKTNGDCIRRMTDEELANAISNVPWCEECPYNSGEHCGEPRTCTEGGILWLRKEVHDGN